jgi:hypothetical protein
VRRRRLNKLSPTERAELSRQLKDVVEAGMIRPIIYIEFGSPIIFVRKAYGSLRQCIDYRGLINEVTRKDAYPLPRVDDTLDELKDGNFYTHLDLASCFSQVRVRDQDVHKTAFQTPDGLMDRLCIPQNSELRLRLITELHASSSSGRIGVASTLAKALDRFWWRRLRRCERFLRAVRRMSTSKDSTANGRDSLPTTCFTQTVACSWS